MERRRISLLLCVVSATWLCAARANAEPIPHGQFRVVAEHDAYRFRVGPGVDARRLLRYVNQHEPIGLAPVTMGDLRRVNAERGDWNHDGMGNLVYACGHHDANARRFSRSSQLWTTCPGVHQFLALVPQHELYWVPRRHTPDPADVLRDEIALATRQASSVTPAQLMDWNQRWFGLVDLAYQPSAHPLAEAMNEIVMASQLVVGTPVQPVVAPPPVVARATPSTNTPSPTSSPTVEPDTRTDNRVEWMTFAIVLMITFCLAIGIVCVIIVMGARRSRRQRIAAQNEADELSGWKQDVLDAYLASFHGTDAEKPRDLQTHPLRHEEVRDLFRYASHVLEALHAPLPIVDESPDRKERRNNMVRDLVIGLQKKDSFILALKDKGVSQPEIVLSRTFGKIKRLNHRVHLLFQLKKRFRQLRKRYLAMWERTKDLAADLNRYDEITERLCGTVTGPDALEAFADEQSARITRVSEPSNDSSALAERYRRSVAQWLGNIGEIEAFEAFVGLRAGTNHPAVTEQSPIDQLAFGTPAELMAQLNAQRLSRDIEDMKAELVKSSKEVERLNASLAFETGEKNALQSRLDYLDQSDKTREMKILPQDSVTDTERLNAILAKHIIPTFREYCVNIADAARQLVVDHRNLVRSKGSWSPAQLREFLTDANRLMAKARAMEIVDMQLIPYLENDAAGQRLMLAREADAGLLYDLCEGILSAEQHRQDADIILVEENAALKDEVADIKTQMDSLQLSTERALAQSTLYAAQNTTLAKTLEAKDRRESELRTRVEQMESRVALSEREVKISNACSRELADTVRAYIRGVDPMYQLFVLQDEPRSDVPTELWMQYVVMRSSAESAFALHPDEYGMIPPGTRTSIPEAATSKVHTWRPPPPMPSDSARSGSRLIPVVEEVAAEEVSINDEIALGEGQTVVMPSPFDPSSDIPPPPPVPATITSEKDLVLEEEEGEPIELRSDRLKP